MFGLGVPELVVLALLACVAISVIKRRAAAVKKCPCCGQSNLKNDKFCKACGKKI